MYILFESLYILHTDPKTNTNMASVIRSYYDQIPLNRWKKWGLSMSMLPSLGVGGYASIWMVKGLYVTHRVLQQTIDNGIHVLQALRQNNDKTPETAVPLTNPHILMQRDGASCACMLLTPTGIFYIQAGTLNVFKAKPWGGGGKTLEQYQQQTIVLHSPTAQRLYAGALAGTTDAGQQIQAWREQLGHLLLHMLLSDIWTVATNARKDVDRQNFVDVSIRLVSTMSKSTVRKTSIECILAWIRQSPGDEITRWKDYLASIGHTLFLQEPPRNMDNSIRSVGVTEWLTGQREVDRVFQVHCELLEAIEPVSLWTKGKWGHMGKMSYFAVRPWL